MSHHSHYVIGYVPAAAREAVEGAIEPLLLSPNSPGYHTFGAPLSADGNAPATHHGTCAAIPVGGEMEGALASLALAFPGAAYHLVDCGDYVHATDWTAWLLSQGLRQIYSSPVL